jgi:DNA-binding transcriptional LysR family regulator
VVLDNNGALSDLGNPLTKVHSLRQIEIVKALAKHHHFGLAAKALRVSQPALTRSLKQLEAELGVTLFDRQGVTPTPFGEIVLRHGERAAAEFHELMREVALAKGLEIGELRIAAGPYPADISGERAIGMLSARHPNLAVELRIANWTKVVADVSEGAVDLGFADVSEAQNDANLEVLSARSRQLLFFCGAEHRWRAGGRWRSRISWIFRGSAQASREGCAGRFPSSASHSASSTNCRIDSIRASWSKPSRRRSGSSLRGWASAARRRPRSNPSSRPDGA